MSFVTYGRPAWQRTGFGDTVLGGVFATGDGTPYSLGSTSAGAVGLATKAVTIDPTVNTVLPATGAPTLSPFSNINLAYLGPTLNTALNTPLQGAVDAVIAALPDKLMGTISDVLGAVASAVPVVGAVFSLVGSVVDMLGSLSDASRNQEEAAQEGPLCQAYLQQYAILPTGGALDPCKACPADIFFPSVIEDHSSDPVTLATGPHAYRCIGGAHYGPNGETIYAFRPALGQALMLLTEGSYFDPLEVAPQNRTDFQNTVLNGYAAVRTMFAMRLSSELRYTDSVWWGLNGGVPYDRRMLFQQVRRAIQGASKNYGHRSDAGLSLWPIYMDLLVAAYDTGQLNDEWVTYALQHLYCPPAAPPGSGASQVDCSYYFGSGNGGMRNPLADCASVACATALSAQIAAMVHDWKNTVQNPGTASGWSNLQGYIQKAEQVALRKVTPLHFEVGGHQVISARPTLKPPASKFHPSAALFGAGAAAAVIYFFL